MGITVRDILLAAGVVAGIGIVYYLVTRPPSKFALILEATKGGTTDPLPGRYEYDAVTMVTLTAVVFDGYEFDGWFVNGEVVSTDLTYVVDVSETVLVIASFSEIGAPPLIPAYVRPIQNAVAEQWWKTWSELNLLTDTLRLGVDFQKSGYVKFKICDAAGNGVAGQQIAVYTDPNPDELDLGYVLLNDSSLHDRAENPLILTSDADGVVAAKVDYMWIEPGSDYRNTIGYGGKVQVLCPIFIYYDVYPIKDGYYINRPCAYTKFTRMKHPIFRNINYIHAYWVANPSLPVWGDAFADCMIKIEGDKKY